MIARRNDDPIADATLRQRRASDPSVSAWVGASAGSGKTQVLTNRILRLLLSGARPESLLCLTYTRAAAANMATRLYRDLAAWVRLPDAELHKALADLSGMPPTPAQMAAARRLLAVALDAPGGMRIGTIHSFAQTLLRRFPLEARVAPHFALLEDSARADLLRDAREAVFASASADASLHAALDRLARQFAPGRFGTLVTQLIAGNTLPHDRAGLLALFGLPADATRDALAASFVAGCDRGAMQDALTALQQSGKPTDARRVTAMRSWLALDSDRAGHAWRDWARIFLTEDWRPKRDQDLATKDAKAFAADLLETMCRERERLHPLVEPLIAAEAAEITSALARLSAPVFAAFHEAKQSRASLDYDDLIASTERLLGGEDAPWVLFRLDGGLDHLLVDEAQDTAPAQWRIAASLTGEFFAGEGARDGTARTVFAVGDEKQSIFSFQGAAPEFFAAAGHLYARAARQAGREFTEVSLPVSFRSTQAVLDLVNAVQPAWGEHRPARVGAGGSVELWPLFEPPPKPDDPFGPPAREADALCAEALAETLSGWIGSEDLPARGRAIAPGDILVLVRRRKSFVGHLVAALKKRGVPVAGRDRLRLTDSLAVQDCLGFLDALLLPEDDLNLAAVLKGPFCALDETSLMELALGRPGRLIAALRVRAAERADWRYADTLIETFRGRADFADAHALLAELLDHPAPHAPTGRAALIAQLGEEAVEPIDELLQAALADSLRHPPSLQGFLHRLRTANAEIKRDADQASDAVRIMTVHGAKGLQAPLVVLADTTALPDPPEGLVWIEGKPVWLPPRDARPAALQAAFDAERDAQLAEYERLLYVALTRAEDRLVVVGWKGRKGEPDGSCWYHRVAQGFTELAAVQTVARAAVGAVQLHACAQRAVVVPAVARVDAGPRTLPAWATAAPAETPAPQRLKPSGADDEPEPPPAPPPFDAADPSAARRRRGDLTHLLLQLLPTLPKRERAAQASAWLGAHAADLDPALAGSIAAEALAVLDHPDAAPLFDPEGLSEAPIVGVLGGRPVNGVIDRLVIAPDRIWLADYKTDRAPPERPEDAPEKYLRQLTIYRTLLGHLYPDRPVHAVLVWTAIPRVMTLPPSLLDQLVPVKVA